MTQSDVQYFVFDVESVADGSLVASVRYPGEGLSADEAVSRFREELMEQYNSDFIPYTFQLPVSVVIAKIDAHFRLLDIVALDEPGFRPHVITDHFWRGWRGYDRPTLVTFNGRGFDVPLLELAAFRFGISVPDWFSTAVKTWDQHRNRYNTRSHLDLYDMMTNFGASRFRGGLNLAAHLLGKPGKMEVEGYMVQDLFNEGKIAQINDYCRCDVLDTYFVFLRSRVLVGQIALDQESRLIDQAKEWISQRAADTPAYDDYLKSWGDWKNPWEEA